MNFTGRIIGFILGAFFGPLTALFGFFTGLLYDRGFFDIFLAKYGYRRHTDTQNNTQQLFFDPTFAIMGYLAKSDGHVSKKEISVARQVMMQFGLNEPARERAIKQFYSGTHASFNLSSKITLLRQAGLQQPTLLRTFIEAQLKIANADGMTIQKRRILENICSQLGLHGFNFNQGEERAYNQRYYQHNQQSSQYNSSNPLDDAFKVLDVSSSAAKEEVKKAYRRKMSQNHPDKLMAKNASTDMIKAANQKTAQIKKAYETIKQAKGW